MMMPSTFIIFELSIVVLLMTTLTTTTNVPEPTSIIGAMSQSYDDERNPIGVLPSSSKHIAFTDDDSLSDEEYDNNYPQFYHSEAIWPQIIDKRYTNKVIRGGSSNGNGGDSRLWAIPYRFGKRAAMPYRFGKRAGMQFRLKKRSATL